MRKLAITIVLAVFALVSFAPAASAQQKPHRRECVKLTQQIARYERDAGWARERGNALWERSNEQQITRLSTRRERLCPEFRSPDYTAEFVALLDLATKAAARWFLGGL